jgi:hypothetical protein
MTQPAQDSLKESAEIRQALLSRISKATPDEERVLALLKTGRARRRYRRMWASVVTVAAATAGVAIIPALSGAQHTLSGTENPTGVIVSTNTSRIDNNARAIGSASSSLSSRTSLSEKEVPAQTFVQQPSNPSVCSQPAESAVVPLARYGSSPPIPLGSTPAARPVDQMSDNVMYTVDGAPGRGTLCVRRGRITTTANLSSNTEVMYLVRTDQTDGAHSYAGAVGPGVAKVEIDAASSESPITDPYVGTLESVRYPSQTMGSQDLGEGWYSFNLPVYSPTWSARLTAYDADENILVEISLP